MQLRPLVFLLLLVFPTFGVRAFTIVKDVSRPPVEKLVLFEKSTPPEHLTFFNKGKYPFTRGADGSLVLRIDGNEKVDAGFTWATNPKLTPSFTLSEHAAILVTFRFEGANRSVFGNGQVVSRRADNMWNTFAFYNEKQEAVANGSLADGAPGGKTPSETVTIRLPVMVLTYWGENPRPPIYGFGFQWNEAKNAKDTRDYTLVIDRVVVVD